MEKRSIRKRSSSATEGKQRFYVYSWLLFSLTPEKPEGLSSRESTQVVWLEINHGDRWFLNQAQELEPAGVH